jgi:hypothetical protein
MRIEGSEFVVFHNWDMDHAEVRLEDRLCQEVLAQPVAGRIRVVDAVGVDLLFLLDSIR